MPDRSDKILYCKHTLGATIEILERAIANLDLAKTQLESLCITVQEQKTLNASNALESILANLKGIYQDLK